MVSKLKAFERAGVSLSDVAVLYRTHAVGRSILSAVKAHMLPCEASAADVFARPDVAPIMAVLRLIANADDSAAFRTVASAAQPAVPQGLLDLLAVDAARRQVARVHRVHAPILLHLPTHLPHF